MNFVLQVMIKSSKCLTVIITAFIINDPRYKRKVEITSLIYGLIIFTGLITFNVNVKNSLKKRFSLEEKLRLISSVFSMPAGLLFAMEWLHTIKTSSEELILLLRFVSCLSQEFISVCSQLLQVKTYFLLFFFSSCFQSIPACIWDIFSRSSTFERHTSHESFWSSR